MLIVRDRLPGTVTLVALATLEAGLVVQLVIGLGRVFGEHGDLGVAAYIGYLVGALLILPIGFVWSAGERTRSGTAVLLVAVLALPVLFLPAPRPLGGAVSREDGSTSTGFGRVLVFVYGIFAVAATARSAVQLATKACGGAAGLRAVGTRRRRVLRGHLRDGEGPPPACAGGGPRRAGRCGRGGHLEPAGSRCVPRPDRAGPTSGRATATCPRSCPSSGCGGCSAAVADGRAATVGQPPGWVTPLAESV